MSIFNKFKHKKEEEAVSNKEAAKVNVAKKEAVAKEEIKTGDTKTKPNHDVYGILVRPLITEKATDMSKLNKYVFEVSVKANKIQISQAIESRYGVKPVKINVLNNVGRKVRYGRNIGRTKAWRKAVVTIPKGKSIQIHEGV